MTGTTIIKYIDHDEIQLSIYLLVLKRNGHTPCRLNSYPPKQRYEY